MYDMNKASFKCLTNFAIFSACHSSCHSACASLTKLRQLDMHADRGGCCEVRARSWVGVSYVRAGR